MCACLIYIIKVLYFYKEDISWKKSNYYISIFFLTIMITPNIWSVIWSVIWGATLTAYIGYIHSFLVLPFLVKLEFSLGDFKMINLYMNSPDNASSSKSSTNHSSSEPNILITMQGI